MSMPPVVIPDVPRLLSPDELAAKQQADIDAAKAAEVVQVQDAADANRTDDTPWDERPGSADEPVERDDDGPVPGLPDVPAELLGLDAAGLVAASDSIGEMLAAMLLAAKINADSALAGQVESLGKSMSTMVAALESVRLMLADEDTADTLGPVAVTAVDYLTAEILAWLTGSRPATGTEHAMPVA